MTKGEKLFLFLFSLTLFVFDVQAGNRVEYGIGLMNVYVGKNITNPESEICFSYASQFYNVPTKLSPSYKVKDLTDVDACLNVTDETRTEIVSAKSDDVFLLQKSDNCTLSHYFDLIRNNGSGMILISGNRFAINESHNLEVFAIISNASAQTLLQNEPQDEISVRLITAEDKLFNPSTLILWGIAFICVMVGSYTGPYREIPSSQTTPSEQRILDSGSSSVASKQQISLNVIVVIALVVFISTTLLLLYFFYKYLVYFFMAIFCIASARATYDILLQILNICKFNSFMPKIRNVGIHKVFLLLLCVTVPILWFVYRHKTAGWILQDYLGICFCIHLIQTLRMPSLKVLSVFLILLFVYDIFFVFVTPYLTKDGQSIMVEVATGGSSGEELPLLLKIPQLETNILSVCSTARFSLLGFGDIIIPGFLVCFAHSYDIINGDTRRRPYFITALLGYGFGLALAFVALSLSKTGQPALLYVVPSTLIPIYVVALCKKQLRLLWDNAAEQ